MKSNVWLVACLFGYNTYFLIHLLHTIQIYNTYSLTPFYRSKIVHSISSFELMKMLTRQCGGKTGLLRQGLFMDEYRKLRKQEAMECKNCSTLLLLL